MFQACASRGYSELRELCQQGQEVKNDLCQQDQEVKNDESFTRFAELHLNSLYIMSFSDASYNNLRNGGSQGGHLVFLVDKDNNIRSLGWKSNRLKSCESSPRC